MPPDIGEYIEELRSYDNIALSFFRITPECKESAETNFIKNGVTEPNCPLPHIDLKSGNIHPNQEYVEQYDEKTISQLVLCNGLGPKISTSTGVGADNFDSEVNLYPNNSDVLYVHKAFIIP